MMPSPKKFRRHCRYERVFVKIPSETNRAFAMLDKDRKEIAPAVDSLRVMKRLKFVDGQVVGMWAYSPSIFEHIRSEHQAAFEKANPEAPKGILKT